MTLPISWACAGRQTASPANKPQESVEVSARLKAEFVMVFNSDKTKQWLDFRV
jgi:hypothetical protein